MRRVKVYALDRVDGELMPVSTGEIAYFHTWGVDFEEFESGPANMTVAIVEFKNGSIGKIDPKMVQFVD